MLRLGRLLAITLIATSTLTGTIAVVAGSAAAADTYVVRSGDSLGKIAARLDVALAELLRVNNLTVRSVIHPGQQLIVPGTGGAGASGSGGTSTASRSATTYVVKAGDSLGRIAQRHGVTLTALLQANNMRATSLIVPGQRLTIPGTGSGGGATGGGATGGGATGGGSTSSGSYVVKAGDSLGRIAQRHGVTLTALLQANNMRATSLIIPGQRLVIPGRSTGGGTSGGGSTGGGTSGGGTAGATTYVVKSGDYLARIATNHGVALNALLTANRMTATSLIVPGQVLRIPARGTTPTPQPPAPPRPTTPPTTAPRPTTPPASSGGPRYVVRPGDSLGLIAREHNIELRALLAANGMSGNSLIVPGQAISLPTGTRLNPIDRVLNYAFAQVGKPWRFFSRGPNFFDCSGLTTAAYGQIGVGLIHQSAQQARQGRAVDFRTQPVQAGDLVFQDTDGDGIINHVGIALSDSTWIQARSTRAAVAFGPLPPDSKIVAVRRIL